MGAQLQDFPKPDDIESLKTSHSELLTQWKRSSKAAAQPEMPAHLFRNIPSHHVDVPAAKMEALETARAFARASAVLAKEGAIPVTQELRSTLNDMAEFSAAQYTEADRYADLKWPHTLIDRSTEIDTDFHKRRRLIANETMLNIVDALGALNMAR